MDWHVRVSLASHNDVFLRLGGLVDTVGVLGVATLAAVCDVHSGVALVAVGLPILAGDIFLEAHSLDIGQGLVHKGVHRLAPILGQVPALHHLVAVVGAAGRGRAGVHVLPLKLGGCSFLA